MLGFARDAAIDQCFHLEACGIFSDFRIMRYDVSFSHLRTVGAIAHTQLAVTRIENQHAIFGVYRRIVLEDIDKSLPDVAKCCLSIVQRWGKVPKPIFGPENL